MKTTTLTIISIALIGVSFMVTLKAVDRITVRDCERGIKEACQYVK